MKLFTTLFVCFLVYTLLGQQIPHHRITDWSSPGACISVYDTVVSITDFGGDSTGVSDNSTAFNAAKNALGSRGGIIQFSQGNYLFTSSLSLSSGILIRGKGSRLTQFTHNLSGSGHLFRINGSIASSKDTLIGGFSLGSDSVEVLNGNVYQIGDVIKIVENDGGRITSSWASNSIGQITKITRKSGNWLYLDKPLRQQYSSSLFPRASKISAITNVGFECFSIRRLDPTSAQTKNFDLNYAANCHFKGVRSDSCNFSHISISNSTNITVANCFFKNAFNYGSGGKAYGVVLQATSGNCLIENNQFEHLRHSVLLQSSSNGNVISYNYSLNPYWTGVFLPSNSAGDMVLHGNYPYMNLFEGNICQNIVIDNSHGINGKFNTFLRNRAELYGIFMNISPASDSQNFVGNEITNTLIGMKSLAGNGHFDYGNKLRGSLSPTGTNGIPSYSLYLQSPKPLFWNPLNSFPIAGNPINYNTFSNTAFSNYMGRNFAPCLTDTLAFQLTFCPTDTILVGYNRYTLTGNFTDSSINSSGCMQYLNLDLHHFSKPTITATWFLSTSLGSEIQWYFNDTALIGDSLQTLPIYKNGWYQVALTDSNGCRQISDSLLVNSLDLDENKYAFSVYPNPVSDKLIIQSFEGGNKVFQLIALDGKKVMEWESTNIQQEIQMSHLPSGIYFLHLKGTRFQKKIIKN